LTYIVKDTFEYIGDNTFETLEDFLLWFWQGTFDDYLALIPTKTDTPDSANILRLMRDNLVEEHWNAETKIYTRLIDYGSEINYLANRMVVQSLPYWTDPFMMTIRDNDSNLIKTTEIIE
jgi:hypothetical protein